MTDVTVLFHHPADGCGLTAETQEVVFRNLTLAGLVALLALEGGFWNSSELPRCETSGQGLQVVNNCRGVVAKELC